MKLFIWDFHGVLEKGNENAVIEISNAVLENAGFEQRFDPGKHAKLLYGKRWNDYFKFLIPDLAENMYEVLADSCFQYQSEHSEILTKHFQPNDFALEVLEAVSKKHTQIIISGSRHEDFSFFMDLIGISKFFPEGSYFGVNSDIPSEKSSKEEILRRYLFRKQFDDYVIIGDSDADMKLANILPTATSYAYTHKGFTPRTRSGDFAIDDLREVLKSI